MQRDILITIIYYQGEISFYDIAYLTTNDLLHYRAKKYNPLFFQAIFEL